MTQNHQDTRMHVSIILQLMEGMLLIIIVVSSQVMPILVFLSSVISVLYYIGFMQWLICKVRNCSMMKHGAK